MSKRLVDMKKNLDLNKVYNLAEAIALLKNNAKAKFNESIDVSMNLNLDAKKSDQNLRGSLALPHGIGRACRVAVFARDAKAEEAKAAGADIVGDDDLIDEIAKGNINFDACVATPDMMTTLSKVARILGPKGLMPNPKLGTVTTDVGGMVKSLKAGRVNYKNDKGGIVHAIVGKAAFSENDLIENIKAFVSHIEANRPSGVKGKFVKHMHLSSTQGVAVKFEI